MNESSHFKGYQEINGLRMYYEVHGKGRPLLLIHGGGSTIESSFGRLIPLLSPERKVIAVELQAHGHTADRGRDTSFVQDADDVAALLRYLDIPKSDILGFSNGGHTAIELALRHPALVNKIILASTFYKRTAAPPEFWDGFEGATLDMMPPQLAAAYLQANNSQEGLLTMFNRDVKRMKEFRGWTDEQMKSISAPVLVLHGNYDVGSVEHAVEMYRILPDAELAILPANHGDYLGAIESIPEGEWKKRYAVEIIREFLDKDPA